MPPWSHARVGKLYARAGFRLRHCHQIGVAIFVEACRDVDLTPGQYGSLYLIDCLPGIDQRTLALRIGLDRSTTGAIVRRLAERGLVERRVKSGDRRSRCLELTASGKRLLLRAQKAAGTAQERLLSPLSRRERRILLDLLWCLIESHRDVSRAAFVPEMD
jgi:DNA-binding MarR family transcriptional regulator